MSDEHVLNGRRLEDWELPALARARARERGQAERVPRPVTDLVLEFSWSR